MDLIPLICRSNPRRRNMRAVLLAFTLLSLSIPAAAQGWLEPEAQLDIRQVSIIFEVQLLLGAPPGNNPLLLGPVFQVGNPSPIGAWIEDVQFPLTSPPCTYCRPWWPSRFRRLTVQAQGPKAPDGSTVFIDLYVTVDGSRVNRTGLPVTEGQWVLVEGGSSNPWKIQGGGVWIIRDDNGEWRLGLTLER